MLRSDLALRAVLGLFLIQNQAIFFIKAVGKNNLYLILATSLKFLNFQPLQVTLSLIESLQATSSRDNQCGSAQLGFSAREYKVVRRRLWGQPRLHSRLVIRQQKLLMIFLTRKISFNLLHSLMGPARLLTRFTRSTQPS